MPGKAPWEAMWPEAMWPEAMLPEAMWPEAMPPGEGGPLELKLGPPGSEGPWEAKLGLDPCEWKLVGPRCPGEGMESGSVVWNAEG